MDVDQLQVTRADLCAVNPPNPESIRALLHRVDQGDEAAIEYLHGLIGDLVGGIARAFRSELPGLSPGDLENEAWSFLISGRTHSKTGRSPLLQWEPTDAFIKFLGKCLRNRFVELLRAERTRSRRVACSDRGVEVYPDRQALNPQRAVVDAETRKLVWECVSALRQQWQITISLLLEGVPEVEIATSLAVPEGTVNAWVSRAKKALRKCLHSKGFKQDWAS